MTLENETNGAQTQPGEMEKLHQLFANPKSEHTACPLWFWNGDLEPNELLRQVGEMFDKGVRGFVIHARVGHTIAYLSDEWMHRCGVVIEEAARRGMKVWIYDEENWASGYAGGRVLARDPNHIGQNVVIERHYVEGPTTLRLDLENAAQVKAVLATRIAEARPIPPHPLEFHKYNVADVTSWTDQTKFTHIYAEEEAQVLALESGADGGATLCWDAPEGLWCVMVALQKTTDWIAAYSDCYYSDLINDSAMQAFIEETHEKYFEQFKQHFGDTVLGFFIDEPGFYNNFWDRNVGSITWTHDLAEQFEARRGYSLLPHLPHLWENLGPRTEQIRCDFCVTISELLHERCFGKIAAWCEAHGVMLTGHLEWEEWMHTMVRHSMSPFASLAPFQVPAVDKIDEVTDKISEKLVSSIAHFNGRERVLSETFALIGWKLAPTYMKRIVDYQFVRGVNWLNPHGFFYSTDDFRKFECPPSEFFQNPWWEHSKPLWDHVARLSVALTQGHHVAPVALYYPSEQGWATMTPNSPPAFNGSVWESWQLQQPDHPVNQTDLSMQQLALRLMDNQFDFDFVDHAVLASTRADGSVLHARDEAFRVVVVPRVDVLVAGAMGKLLEFARGGGLVLFVGSLPTRAVNGVFPAEWETLRETLSGFALPEFAAFGEGRVGFAPQGIEGAMRLLRGAVRRDVEVSLGDDDALLWQEHNRGGPMHEVQIRPLHNALKYYRRRVGEGDVYFLVNESDRAFTASLNLAGGSAAEEWEPFSGEQRVLASSVEEAGRVAITLHFAPWQSHLVVLKEGAPHEVAPLRETLLHMLDAWNIDVAGVQHEGALISWPELGLSAFSGTGNYRATFSLPELPSSDQRIILDLGDVLDTAQVQINETLLAPLPFAPYRIDITDTLRAGENTISLVVANTNTNEIEKRERPSGLLGPVRLLASEPALATVAA